MMKSLKYSIIFLICFVSACGGVEEKKSDLDTLKMQTTQKMGEIRKDLEAMSNEMTQDNLLSLLENLKKLEIDDESFSEDETARLALDSLDKVIADFKASTASQLAETVANYSFSYIHEQDKLIEGKQKYVLHMNKGEVLNYDILLESPAVVRLYNMDAKKLIKTHNLQHAYQGSYKIPFTAIYMLEIAPRASQYISLKVSYKTNSLTKIARKQVKEERIVCARNAFGAEAVRGVDIRKITDAPIKVTLRSQFKALFTGGFRSLIPINVPKGCTDIMYSLRVSSSEQPRSEDGKFYENTNTTYRKIKFLGLPIYESSKGLGILAQLLDDNRPHIEEDYYCNFFVFRLSNEARKFSDDNCPTSRMKYDLNYSLFGTQSCNGRIPLRGATTVYIGVENERARYSTYIWLEALAVMPKTDYYRTVYHVD